MLDNELQRTIYTLVSIIINIVQYLRNRHFQNWLWHRWNPTYVTSFETNYLEISSFCKNRRIDKSRKNRNEETKIKYQSERSVLSANRLRSMFSGSSSSSSTAICSAYWVASFGRNWLGNIIVWLEIFTCQAEASLWRLQATFTAAFRQALPKMNFCIDRHFA